MRSPDPSFRCASFRMTDSAGEPTRIRMRRLGGTSVEGACKRIGFRLGNPDERLKLIRYLILVAALGALAVRAPRLGMRPMHTDEAVHADKFGTLLENGAYEYNPDQYHGPTLNYFTLIPAWLSSANKYTEITEVTLRIVPVLFGVGLVALTVLTAEGLGLAAVVAAMLVALSPAMVFYSRYYIQEMLLVCFTFGAIACGYRYVRSRRLPWAILTGVFAGLMHATKETAIIAFAAMGLALVLVFLVQRSRVAASSAAWRWLCPDTERTIAKAFGLDAATRQAQESLAGVRPLHVALGLAAAIIVSALFYSSFLTHPRGILDSYVTYANYLGRAGGENTRHVYPWYYYLRTLLVARYGHGPIWTEGWIVLLALAGVVSAVKGTRVGLMDPKLVRFIAFYTVTMTVVYSAIPYKTPWCLLSFLHGMILLAGVGAVALLAWARRPAGRIAVLVLLMVAAGHLAFQTYRANFVYHADSRNPYVYAHPTEEIFTAVEKVKEYAGLGGLGLSEHVPIQVAVPGDDYWPLPWYLRALKVEWRSDVPEQVGPLILISDKLEGALTQRLYVDTPREKWQMYLYLFDAPYYVWARPQVKLLGFVRKDLWDEHAARQSDANELLEGKRGGETPTTGNNVRQQ